MHKCIKCGTELSPDDIGCHRKLINRGAEEFMCISCLASHFGTTEERLRELIEEYRAYGCTLFSKK